MFFNYVEEVREELREQVYDVMGEKEGKKIEDKFLVKFEIEKEQEIEMEKGGREDMDVSEFVEELQEKVELILDQLIEIIEEIKGVVVLGLKEVEVIFGKLEQVVLDVEEGKLGFGIYV